MRELIPRKNVPIICGVEGRKHISSKKPETVDKVSRDRGWDHVRWSQMRWAGKHDVVYRGPNTIDVRLRDGGHFHSRDRLTWAARMTQCVLYVLGEEDYSGAGIFFDQEQCSLDKNVITLKVKHQGGNRLVLPFPEKPIEGIAISDDGFKSHLKISRTEVVQPDTVRIILQEAPKNRIHLGYLTGEGPVYDIHPDPAAKQCLEEDSNNPPGNILYDNAKLPPGNMREELGLGIMVNGTIGHIELTPKK